MQDGQRKRHFISTKFTTDEHRLAAANKIIAQIKESLDPKLINSIAAFLQFNKNTVKPLTIKSYESFSRIFVKFLKQRKLGNIKVHQFGTKHAMKYWTYIRDQEFKKHTMNNYLRFMRVMWAYYINQEITEQCPFRNIKALKISVSVPKRYTLAEKEKILRPLKQNDPELYKFAAFIYYSFARPSELLRLKINEISLKERTIYLGEDTKTSKRRWITITDSLLNIILQMKIERYKPWHNLFGRDLKPGEPETRHNHSSARWFEFRKSIGLPKHHKLYHWKHTGIQDHMSAGVPLHQIARQSGLSLEVLNIYAETATQMTGKEIITLAPTLPTERKLTSLQDVNELIKRIEDLSTGQRKKLEDYLFKKRVVREPISI